MRVSPILTSKPLINDTPPSGVWLRAMTAADLAAVFAIEHRAHVAPWSQTMLGDCLTAGYCCLVIERETEIIGHGIMQRIVDECHILNLCIAPEHQRQGLGCVLLRRLLALGRQNAATMAFLEVRASNHSALKLYQREGFNEIALRPQYYRTTQGREDAIVMACALLDD